MNTVQNILKTSSFILVAMLLALTMSLTYVSADDGSDQSENGEQQSEQEDNGVEVQTTDIESTEEQAEESEEQAVDSGVVYTFTAQPGDSYSEIARKTVQIYGIETETNLSVEQILFVETNLTIAAGSPELNLGQEVSIEQSLVQEWVEKAVELSEAEKSLWTKYTVGVDFNTDAVGEPRE